MFMNGMEATIVNVALPAIGAESAMPPSATSAVDVGTNEKLKPRVL
ncbi:hypothetical protein [Saccharopolyspora hattusasensis]